MPVDPLRFHDGQEEMKAAMAEHAVEIAAKTMKDNGESIATTEGPLCSANSRMSCLLGVWARIQRFALRE